jgi:hypothetical protein
MEKKCKFVHNIVECTMNFGNIYAMHPTLIAFLKIFIQNLKLPFMLKEKPFISYSFSIVAQYP